MKKLFAAFRIKEIVGKSGFFMVGCLFAEPVLTTGNVIKGAIFFGLCLINGASIYLFNAALGYQQDQSNYRLENLQTLRRSDTLTIACILAAISLTATYFFSPKLILPSVGVYLIWILYSLPKGLKGIPFMGLACALVGQMLHFHIGYMVFGEVGSRSIALSIYFGLLFAAGHALHEVIDLDADRSAGINTTAVHFGRTKGLAVSNLLFILSIVYLAVMTMAGVLIFSKTFFYYAAFGIQLIDYTRLPTEPTNENLFSYRRDYMLIYVIATFFIAQFIYFDIF